MNVEYKALEKISTPKSTQNYEEIDKQIRNEMVSMMNRRPRKERMWG